jgi:hypothetical protein
VAGVSGAGCPIYIFLFACLIAHKKFFPATSKFIEFLFSFTNLYRRSSVDRYPIHELTKILCQCERRGV